MKNTRLLFFILLVAFPTSSFAAHIGDTPEECIARYGKPVAVNDPAQMLTFNKNGFMIVAEFFHGRCECLLFIKLEPDVLGELRALSDRETAALLLVNSGRTRWEKHITKEPGDQWVTEDGGLVAFKNRPDELVIATSAAWDRLVKRPRDDRLSANVQAR